MTVFSILHPLIQPDATSFDLIRRISLLIPQTGQKLVSTLEVLYLLIKLLTIAAPLILMVESSDFHDASHASKLGIHH